MLKSATKVLSQALGQSCNWSLVVTRPCVPSSKRLPKIKPCWWMTGTYIGHCRTLIHAPYAWHFSRSPPDSKIAQHNCFVHCKDCRYILSPMPPVPNIGNAWYVGHGPRYWDATHLGSKFHSKPLEAIHLRESPGQDPRKPWRAAQISSQRFDACRYLRVNALTSCQHIMRYDAISAILCYEKDCQLSGLVCFHCILLIAFWPCGCIKIQGWGMLKDDN